MKQLLIILLLGVIFLSYGQEKSSTYPKKPINQELNYITVIIEVKKSLYQIKFRDSKTPKIYKKAVEIFFKDNLNSKYRPLKTYYLSVYKKHDAIFVDNKKILLDILH